MCWPLLRKKGENMDGLFDLFGNAKINKDFFNRCQEEFLQKIRGLEDSILTREKLTIELTHPENYADYGFRIDYAAHLMFDKHKYVLPTGNFESMDEVKAYFSKHDFLSIFGKEIGSFDQRIHPHILFGNGSLMCSFAKNPHEGLGVYNHNGIIYQLHLTDKSKKNSFNAECTFHVEMSN